MKRRNGRSVRRKSASSERSTASFSPPSNQHTQQIALDFFGPCGDTNGSDDWINDPMTDDDVIYPDGNGGYQQVFGFLLTEIPLETTLPTRLKHDLKLRHKVESRKPRHEEVYLLRDILKEAGEFYGVETDHLAIGWFHGRGGKTSIELGYVLLDEDVILINEILNLLPRYVIEAIVAHELCHLIKPPKPKNGRLIKHHQDFKHYYMMHPSSRLYERHRGAIHAFLFN